MPTLEDALLLAVEAHRGVVDKAGAPYILHPLRLMLRMDSDVERTVAVLHDVAEDSEDHTPESLRSAGYPEEVLAALDCLTRRKDEGESYEAFIERIKPNPLARRVKIADLEDNMDVRRLPNLGTEEFERLARYLRAWQALKAARLADEEGE